MPLVSGDLRRRLGARNVIEQLDGEFDLITDCVDPGVGSSALRFVCFRARPGRG
jgi:hypothetical protein